MRLKYRRIIKCNGKRAGGVESRVAEVERSVREGVYVSKRSVRYEGARLCSALKMRSRILKSVLEWTRASEGIENTGDVSCGWKLQVQFC